ncbi:MAG: class I SAM-dependent methyltransferase [Candidatus Omnitrophica bacterium]|nr:class I SAM-dependent methyltransferase [Candidatus Omnitrophota bacterium]MDD5671989.1 class I SAM-dependent methyltransferase [Candidatus Omnitrophota bacterium]
MQLKKALPQGRTYEQVKNHYLVEKSIAEKIKQSKREERKLIYATMYGSLLRQVPDHPRLTRRGDAPLLLREVRSKLVLVKRFLRPSSTFVEFAPGDCRFSMAVAKYVKRVWGVDISDQSIRSAKAPDNFRLIVYDGYTLEGIEEGSVDVIFSDQLIEHIHPEDTQLHFELAYRLLKEQGVYVFRTPHSFSGPHDISQYFSDEPQGFHLKEWTYRELKPLLKKAGFSRMNSYGQVKGVLFRTPYAGIELCERGLGVFPKRVIRMVAKYLIPSIDIVAMK